VSEAKTPQVKNADDETGHPHTEPATRTQAQQEKSDARLKEIIANAVEKMKRPVTVSDQHNSYPPKVAPFLKKSRPKGREGSR
jgi:hypothetical protein